MKTSKIIYRIEPKITIQVGLVMTKAMDPLVLIIMVAFMRRIWSIKPKNT